MRTLTVVLLFGAVLTAQQTSRQNSTRGTDINRDPSPFPTSTETRTSNSYQKTTRNRSINGRIVPQESVYEQVLYQDGGQKITEQTTQLYDYNGKPLAPLKVRIEERKNSDGTETVVRTSSQQDLNGRFEVQERATSRIVKSGDTRRESSVVERVGLNGSMEVVRKLSSVETKTEGHEHRQVETYLKGVNGSFYEASREVTELVKQPGLVKETNMVFEAGATGQLQPAKQTVSQTRVLADNSEVQESTIYRPWTAGRVGGTGGLQATEQLLVERRPGPGSTVTETTKVRTPSLDYPHSMGKFQKVSEVICSGQCKSEDK